MRTSILVLLLVFGVFSSTAHAGWQLVFSDEFNSGLSQFQNGAMGPWNIQSLSGNNEQQCYKAANATVSNGELILTAKRESVNCSVPSGAYSYSSGVVSTFGHSSQVYGYYEIRALLPSSQAMWPAFWLLPDSGAWPPEIDVFEFISSQSTTDYQTFHWADSNGNHQMNSTSVTLTDVRTNYHTFGLDWQADAIRWYVDGQLTKTITNNIPNTPMYVILNLAVGGGWPGYVDGSTIFPSSMRVDYLRIYKRINDGGSTTPPFGSGGTTAPPASTPVTSNLSISSPSNNASVSGSFTIKGSAGSQWVNVAAFDLDNGYAKLSSDVKPSNGSYSITVDASKLSSGSHNIAVIAFSVAAGQSGGTSAAANLTVNVAAPAPTTTPSPTPKPATLPAEQTTQLTIASPAANAPVSGSFIIKGGAGSKWVNIAAYDTSNGYAKVSADVSPSNGSYSLSIDSSKMSVGTHNIAVFGFSVAAGQSGGSYASVNVAVNVTAPAPAVPANQFSIVSPASGASAQGALTVKGIAGSQFRNVVAFDPSNGYAKLSADVTPSGDSFSLKVDVSKLSAGSHQISIIGFTVPAGQSGGTYSAINLTVNVVK